MCFLILTHKVKDLTINESTVFLDVDNLGIPSGWRVEECIATHLSHSNWPKSHTKKGR